MEFIEWSDETAAPTADGTVAATRTQLDAFAVPGATEEWEDAQ
jgi:hypothetical protein